MAKQVQLMFTSTASAQPYTSTKRLRAIAVTSSKRTSMLPDVPTFAEAGIKGLDVSVWIGISAPAKTPAPVVERLNRRGQHVAEGQGSAGAARAARHRAHRRDLGRIHVDGGARTRSGGAT
jgi:tripartite-type tricarboxylate transporter receptor subunit TctC